MIRIASHDIRVFPDIESLSRSAVDFVLALVRKAAAARGRFSMAISGGSTPKQLYSLLASPSCRDSVPWPAVHVFWADERCVPKENPDSNYKLAFDTFLHAVPIPSENIHRIHGEEEPAAAARLYEEELRSSFGGGGMPVFDLILLGTGEDGHTASLFPGSAAVRETKRLAVPVYIDPPGLNRVTLTLPVLNHGACALFFAAGRSKAAVVHEIFEDGNPQSYPAGLVRPQSGSAVWMLDREAAGALTGVLMQKEVKTG